MSHFALFYYILEGKRIEEPDKNMGRNIRKRNDFSKHQQILDLDHREVKFHFLYKIVKYIEKDYNNYTYIERINYTS